MYDVFRNGVFQLILNNNLYISFIKNILRAHDRTKMFVQHHMNVARSTKLFDSCLPLRACFICMAWPGEEPE